MPANSALVSPDNNQTMPAAAKMGTISPPGIRNVFSEDAEFVLRSLIVANTTPRYIIKTAALAIVANC